MAKIAKQKYSLYVNGEAVPLKVYTEINKAVKDFKELVDNENVHALELTDNYNYPLYTWSTRKG